MTSSGKCGDFALYGKLFCKKIRDMRLKKKIKWSLILITVCACLLTGLVSYRISKDVLIDKTKTMSINLVKQVGLNLDERIDAFSDVSYRILQTSSISRILEYGEAEATENKNRSDDAFRTAILQQSSLYSYTQYALLRPKNGVITEYYKSRVTKLDAEKEEEILDYLEGCVTVARPTNWVIYDGQVYFVRRMIKNIGEDFGIMCFAMTDAFFSFVGTEQEYLTNESIAILGADGCLLKNSTADFSYEQLAEIANYKDGDYYVYTSLLNDGKERYITVVLNTKAKNWCIIGFLSYEKLLGELNFIFLLITIVILGVAAGASFVAVAIAGTISKNVAVIEQGMANYEQGNFTVRLKPASYDETGMLVLQMNYMGMKISSLIEEVIKKETAKQEAEYQTALAQINPHFLYNTLGSLKWAAWRRKEMETADSIDALIHLLRFTIKRASAILPLREEIDYIRNYIAIEKVRYADAFRMEYQIDEDVQDWMVPGFLLQPFLENALIHGLDMSQEDPHILLRGYQEGERLYLEIEDNGVGMSQEQIEEIWAGKEPGPEQAHTGYNSIGIRIVDVRLHSYYGEDSEIRISSEENVGTNVVLVIPKKEEAGHELPDFDCGG